MTRPYARFRTFSDIGLLVGLSLITFIASARIGLTPRNVDNGVAVIFAPWTAAATSIARATSSGSRFVRFGGMPFIAVVMPDETGFANRMLDDGAWLVLDPKTLAACASLLTFGNART